MGWTVVWPHFPAHFDGLKYENSLETWVSVFLDHVGSILVWANGNWLKIGDGIIEVVVRNQHQWVRKPTQQCFDIMLVRR